jgi:hypothetical protein
MVTDARSSASAREVPKTVHKTLAEYRRWQRWWFSAHYIIGVTGAVAGAIAGFRAAPQELSLGLGVLAAVATGLVTFLGPLLKANAYKHAYYLLRSAVTSFDADPLRTVQWLLERHEAAQNIVLTGDYSKQTSTSPAATTV